MMKKNNLTIYAVLLHEVETDDLIGCVSTIKKAKNMAVKNVKSRVMNPPVLVWEERDELDDPRAVCKSCNIDGDRYEIRKQVVK